MDAGHWNIDDVGEFDPADWFGFVYVIEDLDTGRAYLGKKQLRFKRQKTKSNKSRTKDSDWRTYTSSCEPLNEAIDERGKDRFSFRILRLCSGKCELSYEEQAYQFRHNVLRTTLPDGTLKFYNRTIAHFNFGGLQKQTAESSRKMLLTGRAVQP